MVKGLQLCRLVIRASLKAGLALPLKEATFFLPPTPPHQALKKT